MMWDGNCYQHTIFDGLAAQPGTRVGLITLDNHLNPTETTVQELRDAANAGASVLVRDLQISPGARVGVAVVDEMAAILAVLAVWRAGAAAVVIPPPALTANTDTTATRLRAARTDAMITDGNPTPVGLRSVDIAVLLSGDGAVLPQLPRPDGTALLQATSGTTSAPKFAPVTHGQLYGNATRACEAAAAQPGETLVTWVPISHGLGLALTFGCLALGIRVVAYSLTTFLQRPQSWLEVLTAYKAEHTLGSHFAFPLVETFLRVDPGRFDLSRIKFALDTTESIDVVTMNSFLEAAQKAGFRTNSFSPGYGITEATMAVTFSRPGQAPWTVSVNRDLLKPGARIAEAAIGDDIRVLPSLGPPIEETEIHIVNGEGHDLPEDIVGEVRVSGPQVVQAYLPQDGRELPPTVDSRGRLMTGDIGFLHRGELFLCGRAKEMIILGGQNFYAEDYEAVVEKIPGVVTSGAVAFTAGGERMVVLAEAGVDAAAAPQVSAAIKTGIQRAFGHRPGVIAVVPPGTLSRTPSGKRQRQESRRRFEADAMPVLHQRP